ncbi:uncharacterized protein LOC144134644 [Amblyomma americanum]
MESTEKNADETPADSIAAAGTTSVNTRSGHRRHHKRFSKKRPRISGDVSPNSDNAAEASGTSSPHSRKKSKGSRKSSSGRAGRASPDLNRALQATDAAPASALASTPAPASAPPSASAPGPASAPSREGAPEPVSAFAADKSPYELSELGAAEGPARGYASPMRSARQIAAVPGMWTPIKTAEEAKSQAKIVLPIIVAALILGIVGALIFSMVVSGHRSRRHLHVHNTHGANATGASADIGHPDRTVSGWNSDDAGTKPSQRAARHH